MQCWTGGERCIYGGGRCFMGKNQLHAFHGGKSVDSAKTEKNK